MSKPKLVSVEIPCTAQAHSMVHWVRAQHNAATARPEWFLCLDCGTKWSWQDVSNYWDYEKVSCSNCYSRRVNITKLHLEM